MDSSVSQYQSPHSQSIISPNRYPLQGSSFNDMSASMSTKPSLSKNVPVATLASKVPTVASLLISPPEQTPYESFDQGQHASSNTFTTLPPMQAAPQGNPIRRGGDVPPSPPVSPEKKPDNQVQTTTAGSSVKDPILYPEELSSPIQPLFNNNRRYSVNANDITRHINARRRKPLKYGVQAPERLDYEHFAHVVTLWSGAYERLTTDAQRAAYQRAELAQVISDHKARQAARVVAKPTKRPTTSHKLLKAKPDRTSITVKDVVASATGPRNSDKITKPVRQATKPRAKASPAAAEEKKSKSTKTQTVDIDYNHIPDYCPPLDILDAKKMSIQTVSNPRPFEDAELHLLPLLHPQEQDLARNLRIGPATYLTTKRRIFVDRLFFYHFEKEVQQEQEAEGTRDRLFVKDFKKTHAQFAGKIDVNKSSKLHEAFDSVGWFDRKWCKGRPVPTFDNTKDKHFSFGDGNGKPGPQGFFNRKT